MTEKELTCVVCPAGCKINVKLGEDGKIAEMSGYTCARGKKYAESEIISPVRTLTSTVVLDLAGEKRLLPVRTDKPIPKGSLLEAMSEVKRVKITSRTRISRGEVIIPDFIEKGTNLIACKDFE